MILLDSLPVKIHICHYEYVPNRFKGGFFKWERKQM